MYIPKINLATDKEEILAFMQQFSFATLITAKENLPEGTHLPFVVTKRGEDIVLTSHFAKVNKHWQSIDNNEHVLVIFTEPHAYVSPKHYEKKESVPTWNYISVHAYGKGKVITEPEKIFLVLEQTIINYEADYKQQWDNLPDEYKQNMANGIVAFEIVITDLQAKKKLSQNRTEAEQLRIIESLGKSSVESERLIAEYMKMNKSNIEI